MAAELRDDARGMGKNTMRIRFKLALATVIVIGLGSGAGFAAYQADQKSAAPALAVGAPKAGAVPVIAQTNGATSAQQTAGRTVMGVVEKVADREFSVRSNSGEAPATVRVNDQTAIRKQVAGTVADIQPGERISVRGERQSDGTVTAASVQVGGSGGPMPMFAPAAGGQARGQSEQPEAKTGRGGSKQGSSSASRQEQTGGSMPGGLVVGTVESVSDNVITLARTGAPADQNSPAKITVLESASISRQGSVDFEEIVAGTNVLAVGPRGVDGVIVATTVQILSAETGQTMRGR